MKRKSALLVIICLFIGAATIQLSAQSENRTYQGWYEFSYYTDIYCEGVVVDVLLWDTKVHYVVHVKNDVVVRHMEQLIGTATSSYTGEKFKYKEKDYYLNDDIIYIQYNAKGDMGSHYIGTMLIDISGGWGNEVFTPLRTKCK